MIRINRLFILLTGLFLSTQVPLQAEINVNLETITSLPGYTFFGAAAGTGVLCFGTVQAVNRLGTSGMKHCVNQTEKGSCLLQEAKNYKTCKKHTYYKAVDTIGIPTSLFLFGTSILFTAAGMTKLIRLIANR